MYGRPFKVGACFHCLDLLDGEKREGSRRRFEDVTASSCLYSRGTNSSKRTRLVAVRGSDPPLAVVLDGGNDLNSTYQSSMALVPIQPRRRKTKSRRGDLIPNTYDLPGPNYSPYQAPRLSPDPSTHPHKQDHRRHPQKPPQLPPHSLPLAPCPIRMPEGPFGTFSAFLTSLHCEPAKRKWCW